MIDNSSANEPSVSWKKTIIHLKTWYDLDLCNRLSDLFNIIQSEWLSKKTVYFHKLVKDWKAS